MQYWNRTSPPHSVEIEHRLTVVELDAKAEKKIRAQHGRRITALEADAKPKRPPWMPRDYLLTAAGATIALAAIFEKVGWSTAIAGLVRLYGFK